MTLIRIATAALLLAAAPQAAAQPTNMQVVENLVIACLSEIPLPDSLTLDGDLRYADVSTAVISDLRRRNARVFLPDTLAPSRPTLSYTIEGLRVDYQRDGRGYARTVGTTVTARLVSPAGEVLEADRCHRSFDDVVMQRDIPIIERGAPSEATAPLPPAAFRRRVAEPLLLAGATAISVILFFTLRSNRSTSE